MTSVCFWYYQFPLKLSRLPLAIAWLQYMIVGGSGILKSSFPEKKSPNCAVLNWWCVCASVQTRTLKDKWCIYSDKEVPAGNENKDLRCVLRDAGKHLIRSTQYQVNSKKSASCVGVGDAQAMQWDAHWIEWFSSAAGRMITSTNLQCFCGMWRCERREGKIKYILGNL